MATFITVIIICSLYMMIQASFSKEVIEFSGFLLCKDRCQNKILRCTSTADKSCNVECDGQYSCNNVVIERTNRVGNNGIFRDPYLTVHCNEPNSCSNSIINAATRVTGRGQYALNNTHIYCERDRQCMIECKDELSCNEATFNGEESSRLNIYCDKYQSCHNMDLFCPPWLGQTSLVETCAVIGNKDIEVDDEHNNLNIYTMFGWHDIVFVNYNITNGKMHCNLGLAQCDIENGTSCKDLTSPCQQDPVSNEGIIAFVNHRECGIECQNKALICRNPSSQHCSVRCIDEHSCNNTRITRANRGKPMTVVCAAPNACSNSIVYAATRIIASGEYSLNNAEIHCERDEECIIECKDELSCNEATFNGQESSLLDIKCNYQENTCNNMHVYCPPRIGFMLNDRKCWIRGISNDRHNTLNLFCKNGWNDMRISNDYKNNTIISGDHNMMHCGEYYTGSCIITNDFDCECIPPTHAPTTAPTQAPTSPTEAPTNRPTQSPTLPTAIPTIAPTSPTTAPTLPTAAPTPSPTKDASAHKTITIPIIVGCIISAMVVGVK